MESTVSGFEINRLFTFLSGGIIFSNPELSPHRGLDKGGGRHRGCAELLVATAPLDPQPLAPVTVGERLALALPEKNIYKSL